MTSRVVHSRLLLGLTPVLGLASCHKEVAVPAPPAPVAYFDVVGAAATDGVIVGPYDPRRAAPAGALTWPIIVLKPHIPTWPCAAPPRESGKPAPSARPVQRVSSGQ